MGSCRVDEESREKQWGGGGARAEGGVHVGVHIRMYRSAGLIL